jgi:CBS domain-containing protein
VCSGWDTCIVVNGTHVVLGRLGRSALRGDDEASVEDAMTEGPGTVRPSIGVSALLARMEAKNLTSSLITTPDGRIVGVVLRGDLEER